MILLEEKDYPGVVSRDRQLIEHPIRFPPPVVFRLRKFRLSVVSIEIRMLGVDATETESSAELRIIAKKHKEREKHNRFIENRRCDSNWRIFYKCANV